MEHGIPENEYRVLIRLPAILSVHTLYVGAHCGNTTGCHGEARVPQCVPGPFSSIQRAWVRGLVPTVLRYMLEILYHQIL